ncbi:serine/threonine protein kinase japonica group [Lasiosphaeria hispida]|uniref:Serine/threonine protein kinase japonica group n=1 Tax=Lasiosphaeria hispida TaxID=260671 RepID=A0AAJ0HK82_9PEZI|nr:serine/threonine protein kinase japonica group [Lasiosphaeria hispida]
MPTSGYSSSVLHQVQLSSSAEVQGTEPEPDKFNFLSFLATVQALQIEILPLVWDITHDDDKGFGGTSIIYQALVNLDTSFAFKAYRKQQKTEEQVFRTLINEITVLSETSVREHANIAQLQGICWEISPTDDKPWPVLIFEKSPYGDLDHFARYGGRGMTINDRLRLCLDVGRAVMDMHTNRIVHGDIKPKNVLVFKEISGEYRAKVIDFGYSTKYILHDQRLRLPRSEPWHAPEILDCNNRHGWEWTPPEATKTDLFSFGMLCLWLLFEPSLSATTPPPQGVDVVDVGSLTLAEKRLRTKKGELQTYAQQLLASDTTLELDTKMALKEFFNSSLSQNANDRALSLSILLRRLDPQR